MAVENLEIETYFGKCRCCLQYGYLRTMWDQYSVEDNDEIYGQMLTKCFSIPWTKTKKKDQICEDCIWKLREAYKFKQQVLQSRHQALESETTIRKSKMQEMKSEPQEEYQVEYLDEEMLDKNEGSCAGKITSPYPLNGDYEADYLDDDDGDDDDVKLELKYDVDTDSELDSPKGVRKRTSIRSSDADAPKQKAKKLPKDRQHAEQDLLSAVDAVVSKTLNQKQAATKYQVPRQTLAAKIKAMRDLAEVRASSPSDDEHETQNPREALIVIMKHRDNIRSVLAHSNATPIKGFMGLGYVCAFCPEQFAEPSKLKAHTETHGDVSKLYVINQIRTHVARLDITGLKCRICDAKYEYLHSLMLHLKNAHRKPVHFDIDNHLLPFKFDADDELRCVDCGEPFRHFKGLSEHMASAHYRNYVCGVCDKGFVNRVNLNAHKEMHKSGVFYCSECGKEFSTLRKKRTHERTHSACKSVKCGYCSLWLRNGAQKNNHELRTHSAQMTRFECNECAEWFGSQRSLRVHVNAAHLSERPHRCVQHGCSKAFFLKRTLREHMKTHDVKLHECAECRKVFRSVKTLRVHMYSHTNVKEFKCEVCSKSYVMKENLKRHMKEKH